MKLKAFSFLSAVTIFNSYVVDAVGPTTLVDPVPEGGTDVTIKSFANGAKEIPLIEDVKLLGYESPLKWTQTDSGLSVTLPADLSDFKSALVFRID